MAVNSVGHDFYAIVFLNHSYLETCLFLFKNRFLGQCDIGTYSICLKSFFQKEICVGKRAHWLICRLLVLSLWGCWLELHQRHCVVSLSKIFYYLFTD